VIDRRTPASDLPELLRVQEVAEWADVSRGVVYEEIRRGRLAHIAIGRLVRIPRSALVAWANGSQNGNGR
jgi:excisionase family DNA binding protein